MMQLCKISLSSLVHFTVLEVAGNILLCYSLALAYGHVPAWLPMISDCALYPPEKYPFRLGVVLGSCLFTLNVVFFYYSSNHSQITLYIGALSTVCLSIVGVLNEHENNTIHSACAVLFFIGYEIYMVLIVWHCVKDKNVSLFSIIIKLFCCIATAGALIAFIILSINHWKYKVYIAIAEWLGTIFILLYQLTFAMDYADVALCENQKAEEKCPTK